MPRLLITANVADMFRDFLLPFGRHFRARGWQVDAMAHGITRSPACAEAFNRVMDVEWTRNPLHASNFLGAPRTVRRAVADASYDLVHTHTPTAAFVTRAALGCNPRRRTKLIYTAHGFHFHPRGSALRNYAFRTLERVAGRWTDYLVVINRTDEAEARKCRLVPDERLVYMPGIGVDLSYYSPDRVTPSDVRRVREELRLDADTPFLLMIAEFIPRKRHRDVVQAFAAVRNSDAHMVFAGDGPLAPEMQALASQSGIGGRVHFLGFRTDIPALISASAATVLPSEQEGLPRSVMESLCMGRPVIATDIRGCRDLLEHGGGVLVPLGDCERLSQAMSWVLDNRADALATAAKGRELLACHDISHILQMHERLYERALDE